MTKRQPSRLWTENELVAVLSLYFQLEFGHMDARNPAVQRLAMLLNRTPSSIALKLVNFASLDPALQARGISGMGNTSRLDRRIWEENQGRWPKLAAVEAAQEAGSVRWPERATTVERLVDTRLGQTFFRNSVLAAYEGKCCITGISAPELLRASHIIPWSLSERDRMNPANGLCLNALHDAAFDRGLIALDLERKVLISRATRDSMPKEAFATFFRRFEGMTINQPQRFSPDTDALRFHLENVFIS